MSELGKIEYNGITEFKNTLGVKDIKICIYTIPVKDLNIKHNENYQVVQKLKELNQNNKIIVFNEYIIGSFEEITNWGNLKYTDCEKRIININIATERKILERLLLEDIKNNIDESIYQTQKNSNSIYINQQVLIKNNLIIKRKIDFDINIEKNRDIIVGFNLSHGFEYRNTLEQDLQINNILKGERVKDYHNNSTYKFKEVAHFTISDENEYMKSSIIDYYNNKGQSYIVAKISPKTKAVLVETDKGQVFPYIPIRLKKVCDFGNLPGDLIKECNKYIKLKSNDKMKISIDTTVDILKSNKYIKFNKYNMLIERLGYRKYILNRPKFIFGNGNIQNRVIDGLTKHGSYEQKEIKISYFIDPNITKNTNSIKVIKKFSDELENLSKFMGVTIDRVLTKIKFTDIRIENEDLFEADIRNIVDNYKTTSIFIMEDYNSQKYYTLVKKIFGNRNNIPTQFIELSTLEKYFSSNSESLKQAIILNILLGVYGKSGIQPWVLQKSLNADCFIGLDVSRENRLNTVGIVQVVGRDGKILKSKLLTLPQNGEKINIETIKDIFHEANSSYKKMYGKSPKHIVFHRDGISREEIEVLKETANNLCIKFDYVEITKNVKRRIATLTSQDKGWYTQSGAYYSKNNKAYIITTNPFESLGMAQPIRINKVYGDQSIENIVEDIYKLSFMHIGSVLKARLPVTTHYADLSSTYGNRELIPSNIDSNCIHFI